jgi:hypothetical protein
MFRIGTVGTNVRKENSMDWSSLSSESQAYINRYIRTTGKTKEQALQEKVVQEVINEYENGTKERVVFV